MKLGNKGVQYKRNNKNKTGENISHWFNSFYLLFYIHIQ